jgi:hypothetical protein
VADYWGNENARRWSAACELSDRLGWVACDTDPFKLHWTWTLWVEGLAPSDYWETSRAVCRSAFADGRIGLADLVLFADLDADTLRRRKAADPTRTRGRHEMHIRISRSLHRWYAAMARLDPSRIEFRLPANGLESGHLGLGRRKERGRTLRSLHGRAGCDLSLPCVATRSASRLRRDSSRSLALRKTRSTRDGGQPFHRMIGIRLGLRVQPLHTVERAGPLPGANAVFVKTGEPQLPQKWR